MPTPEEAARVAQQAAIEQEQRATEAQQRATDAELLLEQERQRLRKAQCPDGRSQLLAQQLRSLGIDL
ncbi:hypothetical protein NIES4073_26340 [Kalymmatonema gypsitolerans NIES-4073]|nr:hypothetical protein NIES4073_26340 [Scytonema sp. NIES-4073]